MHPRRRTTYVPVSYTHLDVYKRQGVDTALLWMSAGFLLTGLNFLFNVGGLTNAVVIFIMAIYLTLRFADRLMAAIAALASLAIVVFASLQIGAWATTILPFTLMIASALLYLSLIHI